MTSIEEDGDYDINEDSDEKETETKEPETEKKQEEVFSGNEDEDIVKKDLDEDQVITKNSIKEEIKEESEKDKYQLVVDYIKKNSSSPEVDLEKIGDNEEFFNFMLQLAKDNQN
jgi:hypothetical protein